MPTNSRKQCTRLADDDAGDGDYNAPGDGIKMYVWEGEKQSKPARRKFGQGGSALVHTSNVNGVRPALDVVHVAVNLLVCVVWLLRLCRGGCPWLLFGHLPPKWYGLVD
jgi:hypothetical protein